MKKIFLAVVLSIFALLVTVNFSPVFAASIPQAQPDKGLVVFFRAKKAKGAALRFQISDGTGKSLGDLSNGSTFHVYLEPGQHTFKVRAPSLDGSDSVTLNLAAGEIQYLQGEILWGWPTGRPKFNNVPEATAKTAIKKL